MGTSCLWMPFSPQSKNKCSFLQNKYSYNCKFISNVVHLLTSFLIIVILFHNSDIISYNVTFLEVQLYQSHDQLTIATLILTLYTFFDNCSSTFL